MNKNQSIFYKLIRTRRAKRNISMTLDPYKGVIVRAPMRTPQKEIDAFICAHEEWIQKKLAAFAFKQREWVNGEPIFYLGKKYFLNMNLPDYFSPEHIFNVVKKYFMHQAEKMLKERTKIYAEKLNLFPTQIKIRSHQARWGSCDEKNIIRYNWQLITLPQILMDYVIVHELCHIKVKNHSPVFWQEVARIFPEHRQLRKELRKAGLQFCLDQKQFAHF